MTASQEAGGKKIYSITEAGSAWLDAHDEQATRARDRMAAFGGRGGRGEWPGAMSDMKWFIGDVARAMRRVADDPAKTRDIREAIMEAKRKIDAIVAR